ncbi:MAG: NPCBM/NEW2 domain-containing protein, partial [Thermodesulfovibrionales bacterium]
GTLITIGVLLAFMILIRRWYAYWAVAFIVAAIITEVIRIIRPPYFIRPHFVRLLKFVFVVSLAALVVFITVASPILKRMATTNYSDIYSAFRSSDSLSQIVISLKKMYLHMGPFSLLFAAVGAVFSLRRSRQMRSFSVFLFVQLVIIFILFSRTQDFSDHHWYLICTYIAFFAAIGGLALVSSISNRAIRLLLTAFYLILVLVNFSLVFIPRTADKAAFLPSLFSSARHYPLIRHDLSELDRLVNKLDGLTTPNRDSIYVLASSLVLSDDILRNAAALHPGHDNFHQKMPVGSHVDKRDGFPSHLLSADYVVTATPLQRHLRTEGQRVIALPLSDIEQHRGIGKSFERLDDSFLLDNQVMAYIYRRMAPISRADMESLEKTFVNIYPEHREKFRINHLCGLIETKEIDDFPASIGCQNSLLEFTPGENRPTKVTFRLAGNYSKLGALFRFSNIREIERGCGERGGEVGLKILADGEPLFSGKMVHSNPQALSFNVSGIDILTVSVDKGDNGLACDWFTVDNPVIE